MRSLRFSDVVGHSLFFKTIRGNTLRVFVIKEGHVDILPCLECRIIEVSRLEDRFPYNATIRLFIVDKAQSICSLLEYGAFNAILSCKDEMTIGDIALICREDDESLSAGFEIMGID